MKKLAFFTMLAVFAWAADVRAEPVKLLVSGIHWNGCGRTVAEALGKVPSAKVQGRITKPQQGLAPCTVNIDLKKADIGDLAKAAAEADTPHRSKGAPSVMLVVAAPGLTEDNAEKVPDCLKDVKGVDAKESTCDPKKKEIHVKLEDSGGAKLAAIKKALADFTK